MFQLWFYFEQSDCESIDWFFWGQKSADGNNVLESRKVLKEIISKIKTCESGPWFIEFDTYRWREHCGYQFDNHLGYRDENEYLAWKKRDPLEIFKKNNQALIDYGKIDKFVESEIEEAFRKSKNDPFPEKSEAYQKLYSE